MSFKTSSDVFRFARSNGTRCFNCIYEMAVQVVSGILYWLSQEGRYFLGLSSFLSENVFSYTNNSVSNSVKEWEESDCHVLWWDFRSTTRWTSDNEKIFVGQLVFHDWDGFDKSLLWASYPVFILALKTFFFYIDTINVGLAHCTNVNSPHWLNILTSWQKKDFEAIGSNR